MTIWSAVEESTEGFAKVDGATALAVLFDDVILIANTAKAASPLPAAPPHSK